MVCWGLNPGRPLAKKAPYLLLIALGLKVETSNSHHELLK